MRLRRKPLNILLTETERADIGVEAERLGMTCAGYLRFVLLRSLSTPADRWKVPPVTVDRRPQIVADCDDDAAARGER